MSMTVSVTMIRTWRKGRKSDGAHVATSGSAGGPIRCWSTPAPTRVTGKWNCLTESATDEAEAQRILRRLSAEVDAQRGAQTKATLGTAVDSWLKIHESRRIR